MKGILFKEQMFHAVITGRKTETRRIIKNDSLPKYKKGDVVFLSEPFEADKNKEITAFKFNTPENKRKGRRWVSPLFLPAKKARFFITINDVRQEYLHDLTKEGAIEEGVDRYLNPLFHEYRYKDYLNTESEWRDPISSFKTLWESINGLESWNQNPQVYVYTFKLNKK